MMGFSRLANEVLEITEVQFPLFFCPNKVLDFDSDGSRTLLIPTSIIHHYLGNCGLIYYYIVSLLSGFLIYMDVLIYNNMRVGHRIIRLLLKY
jgi:hypothetical protein